MYRSEEEKNSLKESIGRIKKLSKIPMKSETAMKMVEIIVLKYKSPDIESECAKRIIENTKWPFKLTIYDNRNNTANTSRIWNKLINDSTCDYVLIIDSDAFVPQCEPCWLTRMMESIEKTGIVVPIGDNVGGANRGTAAERYPSWTKQHGIWSGYCFLIKKSVFKTIGKFDEDFYIYGQDSEFANRCLAQGGAIFRTDVFIPHLGGASFKKAHQEGEIDREADKLYAFSLFRLKTTGKL